MRKVRTLRHWRQQYDANAEFIFRRRTVYAGKEYHAGDLIPEALKNNKTKLRRFWESKAIELAEFEDPKGNKFGIELPQGVTIPSDVNIRKGNGTWFIVTLEGQPGELKCNGKAKLEAFIIGLVETREVEARQAAELEAAAVQNLVDMGAVVGLELTTEVVGQWTPEQRAGAEAYFVWMADGDDEDRPDEVPEVLRELLASPETVPDPDENGAGADGDGATGESEDTEGPLEGTESADANNGGSKTTVEG